MHLQRDTAARQLENEHEQVLYSNDDSSIEKEDSSMILQYIMKILLLINDVSWLWV